MGLLRGLAAIVTAPIKVATLPVAIMEEAFTGPGTDESLRPLTHSSRQLTRLIKKVAKELEGD